MRHPIWILNSILMAALLCTVIGLILVRPHIPLLQSLVPSAQIKPFHKEVAKIDLSKIYTNDLFDTFKAAPRPVEQEAPVEKPMPQPPAPILTTKPTIPAPKFLEPLKIQIKGIIIGSNEEQNIAIIEDTRDKKAKNYHVGDVIDDAQLVRILKNKVIFIRANGQQEILYVTQHDAELELLLTPTNWNVVIKKLGENKYAVDPDLFVERMRALGHFIDQLNITTVFHEGKSIGCRIGKMEANSVGYALGLQPSDIIESVNSTLTTNAQQRMEIYQQITGLTINSTIVVRLIRRGKTIDITYILQKSDATIAHQPVTDVQTVTPKRAYEEKMRLFQEKERLTPTTQEIRKKEKEDIIHLMERNERKRNVLMESVTHKQ
ncbi:MAG: type II secretion system protein N [Candidatus Babeliales bacterium]